MIHAIEFNDNVAIVHTVGSVREYLDGLTELPGVEGKVGTIGEAERVLARLGLFLRVFKGEELEERRRESESLRSKGFEAYKIPFRYAIDAGVTDERVAVYLND